MVRDRKSTRLNSSHLGISYAVFCLKKRNNSKSETVTPPTLHRMAGSTNTPLLSIILSAACVIFFNDTATTEIYTLSLHDALPIWSSSPSYGRGSACPIRGCAAGRDRKSTRLNSSHLGISYAVFCLKKKNTRIGLGTLRRCPLAGALGSASGRRA